MAAKRDPQIAKAVDTIVEINAATLLRHRAESAEKNLGRARMIGREEGREEGLEKGIEKGREEAKLELVMNGLKKNHPVEVIADISGLSVKEVLSLKKKMK